MKTRKPARWQTISARAAVSSLLTLAFVVSAAAQQQAPMLEAKVETGELPSLSERLPSNPLVVTPVDQVGSYGGTWRSALFGGNDTGWIARTVAYDGLVRYDRDWNEVLPNLAENWSVNDDATVYTFTLRSGVKWSDGQPFTTKDIVFAIELLKNSAYPAPTGFWKDPANPVSVEVDDDQTFRFVFEKPNGLLIDQLASVDGYNVVSLPAHYCGQFHPDHNDAVDALVKEAGAVDWLDLMARKCAWGFDIVRWSSTELPTMNAWIVSEPISGSAARVVFERNPFYWKLDPEGNQLPYIDYLEMKASSSIEEITLDALNGEIDFQDRHIATVSNQPLFYDELSSGAFVMGSEIPSYSNRLALALNLNHDDPVKRALFNDINFRIGLSHAIDRQEIIDVLFAGQGYPAQIAPRPESPFYDEEMTLQYTEFDPELASDFFGKAGLSEKNSDGYYTLSDGQPLSIDVDVFTAQPSWIDILEIMQLQLANSGVELRINAIDRSLMYEKRPGNDFDAQAVSADGGIDVIQEPRHYFPANAESVWAFRWQAWYNNTMPEIAETPPEWAQEQMKLYSQLRQTPTAEERNNLMREILEISKENFPVIGIAMPGDGYYIATPQLRNVAASLKQGWWFPTPAPYDPFQWYFAQE